MYGKRSRLVGQKVPSAKPARSSSWPYPSSPSTISRVCCPISGLGRWLNAGVSRQLERGVLHLARPERRMLDRQVHFPVAQLRIMLDPVLGALHRERAHSGFSGTAPSPRICRASASRPRSRRRVPPDAASRPVTVANFADAAQDGRAHHLHQPPPFLVGMTDDDAPVVVSAGIGAIRVVRRHGWARGSCSTTACRANGRDCRAEIRPAASRAR